MFGLLTKRQAEKEFCKIAQGFKDIKKDVVPRKEIELMIENAVLKNNKVREQVRSSPRTAIRKRADKILNKAEIMQEIVSMLQSGHSTKEMFNIIVNEKQLIKKTCFFKYLKIVREQIARTPQTNIVN